MAAHGGNIYHGREQFLDFSANISPLGVPKGVQTAIEAAILRIVHYPDPMQQQLRQALAEYHGVQLEEIVCGNGGADVLFRYVAALSPKSALIPVPTFSEYEEALQQQGCQTTFWQMKFPFVLTEEILQEMQKNTYDLLVLCSPNNPTGLCIPDQLLKQILKLAQKLGMAVLLDECFLDFVTDGEERSLIRELRRYPNLFILKSMTKRYAIPGLRLGYGLSSDSTLIEKIRTTGQPWSVSVLAGAAGCAALQEQAYVEQLQTLLKTERPIMQRELERLGFRVWESEANFLFFHAPGQFDLEKRLFPYRILLRHCDNYRGLDACFYRTAIRTHEENQKLLYCLEQVLEGRKLGCQPNQS